MGKCINCGKETQGLICEVCAESQETLMELCLALVKYKPGSGDKLMWDQLAIEAEGQLNFRDLAVSVAEKIAAPYNEYYRAFCLAGDRDYLPKNERTWITGVVASLTNDSGLSETELALLQAFAVSAYFSDYHYQEAEELATIVSSYESLPRKAYCIVGDFYTKTRRYEKARTLLERGLAEYEASNIDKSMITKTLLDCIERKKRADEGKSEYMPNPKENAEKAREQYMSFMATIGIEVDASVSEKKAVPKPIPADAYPDVEEIRKAGFDSFVAFALETTGINPTAYARKYA